MPRKRVGKITAWSHSRFVDYDGCPRKARYKHVDKMKEPIPSPEDEPDHPLNRGIRVHKEAEDWLNAARAVLRIRQQGESEEDRNTPFDPLPDSLETFTEEFEALAKDIENCHVEEQWAFKKDWSITDWFGRAAWCRVKLDCAHLIADGILRAIDFKTGKFKQDMQDQYERQLSLYAIAAFIMFPDVHTVEGELWYVDHGEEHKVTFKREDFEKLRARWENNIKPMMMDEVYAPNPTFRCRWCHFAASKGGLCEAG